MNISAIFAEQGLAMLLTRVQQLLVPNKERVRWLMRLTFVSLILLFCTINILVARDASGQDMTRVKLKFEVKNESLIESLKKIQRRTPFTFAYNRKDLAGISVNDVPAQERTVKEILDLLFRDTRLKYEQVGGNIVISVQSVKVATLFSQSGAQIYLQGPPPKMDITGTVRNETGNPMAGVSVAVRNTKNGTTTDEQGRFKITIEEPKVILEFSFVGFESQSREVQGEGVVDIVLKEASAGLNEVVVVGYGTQKKIDITAAIASTKAENFVKGSVSDAGQLIRGKVAGLAVVTPDANPTSVSQINLRGIATIGANSSPLILIDNVPGTLTTVAPEDIESIDILKDGSASAIYGTRGTNGVILITTKKANGLTPITVDLNTYFTVQKITKKLDFMSPAQYRELVAQGKPGATDYGANTNWLDEVTQTPFSQVYNINLRSGTKNTNYNVNLNYRKLKGLIRRTDNTMLYPRIEVNHNMFDGKLKFNANLGGFQQQYFAGADADYLNKPLNGSSVVSYKPEVYKNALHYNPTDPVKDDNGDWTEHNDKTDYANPVSLLEETQGMSRLNNFRTIGSLIYQPISELNIRLMGSRDVTNATRGYYESKKHYSTVHDGKNGYASRGTTRNQEDLIELTATYNKQLGDHNITGLLGYSWRQYDYEDYYMQNWDFPTDDFTYNNMGAGLALKRGEAVQNAYQSRNKLIGYFARLNYGFRDKYLLTASVRREGSSKFGANYKYGNFPAVSAGWNIQKEAFFQNLTAVSTLKLRGGYGITGTEPNDPYTSLNRINFNTYTLVDGTWIQVTNLATNANPDLRWERKKETNIGLDFGLFKNRITGSVDWYNRTTNDLIFDYPVATPPYLYNTIRANAASMSNKGIEVQVNAIVFEKRSFNWTSTINYSTNKNKLLSLSDKNFQLASGYFEAGNTGEPIQQNLSRVQIGQPIGNFWGFKSVDIDENGRWIIEGKDGKPKPIAEQQTDDKQIIGNGLPRHYLAFNNTLVYKDFDLNFTMRGAFGFQILNTMRMFHEVPVMLTRGNLLTTAYDNVYGKRPLADNQELQYLSYYIENGDYWKIDNITLGYNISIRNSKYIKRIRLYVSGSNLKTFTGYKGIDPEVNIIGMSPGVDVRTRYPATTSYTVGGFFTF